MALIAIAAVYVALFAWYIRATFIGQPYWDMLSIITRYLQYQRDGNVWSYLWEPHVQHRHVWMRLLTAFDAQVFSGVALPFVLTATLCQAAAALVLWRAVRRAEPGDTGMWTACLALMLTLTAVAAVDCALPMNGIYPQTVMFSVLAITLFDSGDRATDAGLTRRRVLALLAAMAAAFGNAAALCLWPILLGLAWKTRAGRTWVVAIVVTAAVFGSAYLYRLPGVALGSGQASGAVSADQLLRIADYFFTYLGLPWTRSGALAGVGTAVGVVCCVAGIGALLRALLRPIPSRLDRLAVSLIAFTLATAVLAAVGRSGVDADLRVPVRYSVFVALMHVGFVLLALPRVVARWSSVDQRRRVYQVVVAVAVLLTVQQYVSGEAARATTTSMRAVLARFAAGEETEDMRTVVYVDLTQARRDLNAIHAAGLYREAR
ncbi:MAG: hypothetical protein ABL986_07415 [Vicinamibacterales bacterium]